MAEVEMDDVFEGHRFFKSGFIVIHDIHDRTVFGGCSDDKDDHFCMIKDLTRPFHRFVCTCPEFMEDHSRFCSHLIALYYGVQERVDDAPRMFGDPEEEEPISPEAEQMLFNE